MKKLFKYLKPYMLPTLLAPLFMLLEVAMDLMQPALMSRVIDVAWRTRTRRTSCARAYCVVCALLGVTGGLGNMYFSTRAGYGFARDLAATCTGAFSRSRFPTLTGSRPARWSRARRTT